jgi:hypothetical protein
MALYIEGRRKGNTTRIIDELIQELFTKGKCTCYDHPNQSRDNQNARDKAVLKKVLSRLKHENGFSENDLKVGIMSLTIELKNK